MIRSTDYTHPNPPNDIPSPLMNQVRGAWNLPWPRKPVGKPKGKGPSVRRSAARSTRSGVHKLGKKHLFGNY